MVISFTATAAELDRIELVVGSLPHLRIWALVTDPDADRLAVTCDLPEYTQSIIRMIAR
jgi:hypothetical protein